MVKARERPLIVRGKVFEGKVISTKMQKTATVELTIVHYVPKYERYKKVRSKVKAHVPDNIKVKEGDTVQIGETRKISKTKSFVIISVLKQGREEENESN